MNLSKLLQLETAASEHRVHPTLLSCCWVLLTHKQTNKHQCWDVILANIHYRQVARFACDAVAANKSWVTGESLLKMACLLPEVEWRYTGDAWSGMASTQVNVIVNQWFLSLAIPRSTVLAQCQAGCNKQLDDQLQRVHNCAARVIFGGDRRDHVTPLLRDKLHWLRAKERITFKLCLLV